MKLYTYLRAPNPRRVHMYLAEKGIEVPFETVDIMKRENRTPEFVANINAMGGIPVLELDDGTHIAESVAICRYFEAVHPEPPLFGRTPFEQAQVEMWIRRIELNFMVPVGMVWVHGNPLTKAVVENQIEAMANASRKVVARYFGFLDAHFAKNAYLAGDAFSMADIVALCTADFGAQLNDLHAGAEHTHYADWLERVSGRASAKA
jgi:glutathione S-transferase